MKTVGRIAAAVLLFGASGGLVTESRAQELHLDITLQENADDGRLSAHGFDFNVLPQFSLVVDRRVFGRSFGINLNSLFTDDPGFVSRISPTELNPVDLLPIVPSEALRFTVLPAPPTAPELGGRNLSYWSGLGDVVWSAVPDNEAISIIKGQLANPEEEAVVDGSTLEVPGFVIGGTSGSGSLHEHIKFLMLPDGLANPPAGPDDGVYLMLVEVGYEAYGESIPVWMLYKVFAGGQATLDAAIEDVSARFQLPLCQDGIDNDRDGLMDALDPGCTFSGDMSEREPGSTACDDGIDNDGDGGVDFPGDVDCASPFGTLETPDGDGDGIGDDVDNCVEVANADQANFDGAADDDSSLPGIQHYGDACDVDLDNDGVVAASDFFAELRPCLGVSLASNPGCAIADLDGDGTVGPSDFFSRFRPALGSTPGPGVTEP
ncbi:MAG: hypothetical protein QNK05_21815 [Myxococcota bacterium]|nr:hypothetical protein [Myxococcota bacterium]